MSLVMTSHVDWCVPQRVLVWSIPWMETCCGPWRPHNSARDLVSSSRPPRDTVWFTMTRDSSVSSASTANCWDTWRWKTASRWGSGLRSAPHQRRKHCHWLKPFLWFELWGKRGSARLRGNTRIPSHMHTPEEPGLLIRSPVVRSDCVQQQW